MSIQKLFMLKWFLMTKEFAKCYPANKTLLLPQPNFGCFKKFCWIKETFLLYQPNFGCINQQNFFGVRTNIWLKLYKKMYVDWTATKRFVVPTK